jgi:hypothetical protein
MKSTNSAVSHSGAFSPDRSHTGVRKDDSHGLLTRVTIIAEEFIDTFDRLASGSSEAFYQDHVIATFMAIYVEVALGPLMGALTVYLYSH